MSKPTPLTHAQDLNIPPRATRVTRSTSQLQKEVVPTSEDHEMGDDPATTVAPFEAQASREGLGSSASRAILANDDKDAVDPTRDEQGQSGLESHETAADSLEGRINWTEDGNGSIAFLGPSHSEHSGNEMQDEEEEHDDEQELDDDDEQLEDDEDGDDESDGSDRDDDRSDTELAQIELELKQLEENVPQIKGKYKLVDRLGEGTFSSVYKAIDAQHSTFDNREWTPVERKPGKVYVALKRIYVTSSPVRIHNELEILLALRGEPNIAYLVDAIRHEDQVLAVMPYNRHQDFRSYYRTATLPMLRSYFSCLFKALAATHQLQVIHRDVKPANFLYDTTTGQGVLCDYGLAQRIGGDEFFEWRSECLHSLPGPSWGGRAGRRRAQRQVEQDTSRPPGMASGLHGARMARPFSLWEQTTQQDADYYELGKQFSLDFQSGKASYRDFKKHTAKAPWSVPPGWVDDIEGRMKERQAFYRGWRPAKPGSSMAGNQRVGYLREDRRPSVRANRAGTRGFRAPEVLLKCPDQTVALDIWSAGIILLCFLTRRFPFFNSNDDTEALAEIAAIFGKSKMERCAALHNRTFLTNIPDLEKPPHATLHDLVASLNYNIIAENMPADPHKDWYASSELYLCIDLLKRCLELDLTKRWTAEECLEHPFFEGLYDIGSGRTSWRHHEE